MNKREWQHLQRAIVISQQSTCRHRHGVVIARGAKVLSVAINTERNDPNICTNPKTEASFHAEINALKQLRGMDLSGATLFSARTNNQGRPLNAKPCSRCQSVIDFLEIKKVIWT